MFYGAGNFFIWGTYGAANFLDRRFIRGGQLFFDRKINFSGPVFPQLLVTPLAERFMQAIGHSWKTALVEGQDPVSSLNAKLKMYRNTEHSVTKRKPAEWLFGRVIRTRLPDRRLQTQCESDDSKEAKDRMRERGQAEKERRDKVAREEELAVGMKVLLKQKQKRKGMSRYDSKPYTIVELFGRQAVIQRGNKRLHRETKKFKRFFGPREQPALQKEITSNEDDWEDTLRSTHTAAPTPQIQGTPEESTESAEANSSVPPFNPIESTRCGRNDANRTTDHLRWSTRDRRNPDWFGDREKKK